MKNFTIKTLGDPITVEFRPILESEQIGVDTRGFWHPSTGRIVVDSNQSEVSQLATLVHEYMHVIDEIMVQNGVYKTRTRHESIKQIADNLVVIMGVSGLFKDVSKKQAVEFMTEWMQDFENTNK